MIYRLCGNIHNLYEHNNVQHCFCSGRWMPRAVVVDKILKGLLFYNNGVSLFKAGCYKFP